MLVAYFNIRYFFLRTSNGYCYWTFSLIIISVAVLLTLWVITLRRVVPTNQVYIVQRAKSRTIN